jgi:hypothetical protein
LIPWLKFFSKTDKNISRQKEKFHPTRGTTWRRTASLKWSDSTKSTPTSWVNGQVRGLASSHNFREKSSQYEPSQALQKQRSKHHRARFESRTQSQRQSWTKLWKSTERTSIMRCQQRTR